MPIDYAARRARIAPALGLTDEILLAGAGHLPFVTQAAEFNGILGDILRGGSGEHSSPALPSNSPPIPPQGGVVLS